MHPRHALKNLAASDRGREASALLHGLYAYYRRGEADEDAWRTLLDLFCSTNGASTDRVAKILQVMRPPNARDPYPVHSEISRWMIRRKSSAR